MTTPAGDSQTETNLSEFAGILAPQDGCDPPVVVGGHAVNLWSHLILKAKIENCVGIGQAGRNDVKHVRMMILCVRAFMMEFLGFVSAGEMSERGLVNVLEETVEIVNGAQAVKAAQLWGFDFSAVWPLDELRSFSGDKITRWLAHRFP